MVFSSIEFLFAFLPASLALYALAPRRLRNAALLLASLVFYSWGGGAFVLLLLLSIGSNYVFGLVVADSGGRGLRRRLGIAGSVAVNLGILGSFKYANFAVEQLDALRSTPLEWVPLALPIGISFYTFQSMSYVFDVARGAARPFRNPLDFALYVSMFPQLIAGPIVRFHEIAAQIRERSPRIENVAHGFLRFGHGLVKKVVVADSLGAIAEAAYGLPADELGAAAAWLGTLAYTLQIYFDFSGYSDMAIGLGLVLGFRLPENFARPYSALSITDFWRRWHITLSAWFRDYLYLPLGGSRAGPLRTYTNLVTVFLLVGLWHGANWTFVAWGGWHGALLIAERVSGRRHVESAPHPALARALTFALVLLGWVVFRADDLGHAASVYGALLGLGAAAWNDLPLELAQALTARNVAALVLASAVVALPRDFVMGRWLELEVARPRLRAARAGLLLLAVPYAGLLVLSGSFSPFLYFQF